MVSRTIYLSVDEKRTLELVNKALQKSPPLVWESEKLVLCGRRIVCRIRGVPLILASKRRF